MPRRALRKKRIGSIGCSARSSHSTKAATPAAPAEPADPNRSDLTPPERVTEYVTEDGALPPDEIATLVDRTPFLREGYELIGAVGVARTAP